MKPLPADLHSAAVDVARVRSAIERLRPVRIVRGRNVTKADVLFYAPATASDLPPVAVKDYGARPPLIRRTIGRLLTAREARAYASARDVPGLPACWGRIGPHALALEWVEATPLADLAGARLSTGIFDRLETIVGDLHRRGVALTDLHHRDVLIGGDGRVWIVDLATAVFSGPGFSTAAALDRLAVAGLRERFTGIPVPEELRSTGAARLHASLSPLRAMRKRLRGRSRR